MSRIFAKLNQCKWSTLKYKHGNMKMICDNRPIALQIPQNPVLTHHHQKNNNIWGEKKYLIIIIIIKTHCISVTTVIIKMLIKYFLLDNLFIQKQPAGPREREK